MKATTPMIDFIEAWLDTFKKNQVKQATMDRLLQSKKALADYEIANIPVGEIDYFDIQRYINELVTNGYGISTIKKQVQIVTAPLRQAAALRVIPADPSAGIRMPSEKKVQKKSKEVFAYDDQEQDKLNAVIDTEPYGIGYQATSFMIETGIRAGELLALKWSDISISGKRMKVHATIIHPLDGDAAIYQDSPKTSSSNRTVPLTPKAIEILERMKEDNTTVWVFSQDDKRYTYQKLMWQTKKLCKTAGVPYKGEHVFRHTFATNCYYKGIDVKILSKLLGHADTNITYKTYINLYGDGFDDMYNALCAKHA